MTKSTQCKHLGCGLTPGPSGYCCNHEPKRDTEEVAKGIPEPVSDGGPFTVVITTKVSPQTAERLEKLALDRDTSIAALIRVALSRFLSA